MFDFLKKIGSSAKQDESTPTAVRLRMSLQKRKAYRREMLYQSVREELLGLEALAGMYKFKAMPVDERHHRFIILIEVTRQFCARRDGHQLRHAEIEAWLRKRTYERYGVVIDGMFWRIDETISFFARTQRAADAALPAALTGASNKPASTSSRLARGVGDGISEQEREQFQLALRQGRRPPPLQVGAREYASDLMPLEPTSDHGGTQYGQL